MGILVEYVRDPLLHALKALPGQVRNNARWNLAIFALLAVLASLLWYLHFNTHIVVSEFFEDPVEFGILPLHVGMFSYLSASSMIVAGVLLLFAAQAALEIERSMRIFAAILGGFLFWLGLDDVFMIHEWIGLRLAYFTNSGNVPQDRQWLETYVFAAYALTWILVMIVFARQILRTSWLLLLFTLLGFGSSVLFDLRNYIGFFPNPSGYNQVQLWLALEDMTKLAGSFFAVAYALRFGRAAVRNQYAPEINAS